MKKILLTLATVASVASLTACGGGGGGGGGGNNGGGGGGGPVAKVWYDFFGHACGTLRPDCTYASPSGSQKAMWQNDPYYSYWANAVWATVFDTDLGYYVNAYGFYGVNGVFYDYYTGRAVNEGQEEQGNDMMASIGRKESDVIQRAAAKISAKYELDGAVAVRAAKLLNNFNKIGKSRERTEADVAALTQRMLGLDYNKMKDAAVKGDKSVVDDMAKEAAPALNTTPENMRHIVKDMFQI